MKRAAASTSEFRPPTRRRVAVVDLRQMAAARGYEIVHEYSDRADAERSASRPGLDALLADARRQKLRCGDGCGIRPHCESTRNFLQVIDELDSMGIEFSSREKT